MAFYLLIDRGTVTVIRSFYMSRKFVQSEVLPKGFGDTFEYRFWSKVAKAGPDDCWEWRGTMLSTGYGVLTKGGDGRKTKTIPAHRAAWLIHTKYLPKTHEYICHKCDNRSCVNPSHLFLGSCTDNLRDMVAKGRHFTQTRPERICRGSKHANAKLNEAAVIKMRQMRQLPIRPGVRTLAKMFGVSRITARRAIDGISWKHVPLK